MKKATKVRSLVLAASLVMPCVSAQTFKSTDLLKTDSCRINTCTLSKKEKSKDLSGASILYYKVDDSTLQMSYILTLTRDKNGNIRKMAVGVILPPEAISKAADALVGLIALSSFREIFQYYTGREAGSSIAKMINDDLDDTPGIYYYKTNNLIYRAVIRDQSNITPYGHIALMSIFDPKDKKYFFNNNVL
ncbi:hypothetical protein [Deinococcus cellulosilyticus]|uniref:Uncharacterized protein n=1 Tax=Deinococcus cellulosilyticus (strain DSM 18568 / NBRC 106333 / KACC 11606 / 5516J-15) TaxID=1223518 RepID=A0A511N231_DEIC1|nr:hypothetical protein [Deinococcus cellulosilyticus]GEM46903.1 hypothetical protein DC3_25380 [Deinococcus cellulosilyticus NBRC 106333 = KACC 11606]